MIQAEEETFNKYRKKYLLNTNKYTIRNAVISKSTWTAGQNMPNTYINVELTLENYNNIYRGFIKVARKVVAPNTEIR